MIEDLPSTDLRGETGGRVDEATPRYVLSAGQAAAKRPGRNDLGKHSCDMCVLGAC
jgi:hypothetical protein